jgi:hypothetical protein
MKTKFTTISLLILINFVFSQEKKNLFPEKLSFFDPLTLSKDEDSLRLRINAVFSECGEWGGHKESLIIYSNEKREIYADYKKFSFSCDSIAFYNKTTIPKQLLHKKTKLNTRKENEITKYIISLTKAKMTKKEMPMHSGNIFSVELDEDFKIKILDNNPENERNFNSLIVEILKSN